MTDWSNGQAQYHERVDLKVDCLKVEIRKRYFLDCAVNIGFEQLGFILAAGLFGKGGVGFRFINTTAIFFTEAFFKDDLFAAAPGLGENADRSTPHLAQVLEYGYPR